MNTPPEDTFFVTPTKKVVWSSTPISTCMYTRSLRRVSWAGLSVGMRELASDDMLRILESVAWPGRHIDADLMPPVAVERPRRKSAFIGCIVVESATHSACTHHDTCRSDSRIS